MSEGGAWVTLATNDSYCLGALVLAHSLRRVATTHPLVILVTPQVTPIMKERLSQVFSEVVSVDVLDSGDAAHLALLARPELGITFTKLHCWSLTQYPKCVFLDADTLVLQNCDELFEREELSAAPDVGWPDCFNSGVFVYRPSNETFSSLINFAKEKGSFDGGDQGLLNQFFSSWSTGDISKHLPFLYNVCSTSFYSYLPALKQYGSNMKIVHFIGSLKPWLQNFNWGSLSVQESGHLQAPLQHWWDIFVQEVHPVLDVAMGWRPHYADSPGLYIPPPPSPTSTPQFPWHEAVRPPTPPPSRSPVAPFVDPWDHYTPAPASPIADGGHTAESREENFTQEYIQQKYTPKAWYECYTPEIEIGNEPDTVSQDDTSICGPGGSQCGTEEYVETYSLEEDENWHPCQEEEKKPAVEEVRPRHPYDNFYLLHTTVRHGSRTRCSHDAPPPAAPSPPPTPPQDHQAGVAGALSQLTLGSSEQCPAVEEHLRRQGWEAGNIDYMGADAFDNIWAKISQTLSGPPAQETTPEVVPLPALVEAPKPATAPVVVQAKVEAPVPVGEPKSVPAQAAPIVPSKAASNVSTDSWEQVSKNSEVSLVAPPSSLETSSVSSTSSVSTAHVGKEPQAPEEAARETQL